MNLANIIKEITEKLNLAGVDYYIVGAIGAYLDAGMPFPREHDDLDIFINEKDIPKLAEVFAGTDFDFHDNRKTSAKTLNAAGYTDGEHEVFARHQKLDFHIGFFLFRRDENTYSIIEYFRDEHGQKKLERILPIRFFELQYNSKPILFQGVPVRTVRKEAIYKMKSVMKRSKDEFDREQLAPKIDEQVLVLLTGMHNHRVTKISNVKL